MMKILITLLTLLISLNAQSVGESLYKNIIISNIREANQDLNKLRGLVDSNTTKREIKDAFASLIMAWKRVETLYVAGDMDEEYIDTPRYIDGFHQGKEDIYKQLDHILLSSESVKVALFKNSTKSINALEYLLFKSSDKQARRKEMIVAILDHIGSHLEELEHFYEKNQKLFTQDQQKMNAIIMNALIESTYKLKEWRVGDPAGLSHKYRGDPKASRAEYHISKLSYRAIEAILLTHQAIIGERSFPNFSEVVRSAGADSELLDIQRDIENALMYLHSAPIESFTSKEIKSLYKELTKLHSAYYISLIGRLKMTSKILDSDGD